MKIGKRPMAERVNDEMARAAAATISCAQQTKREKARGASRRGRAIMPTGAIDMCASKAHSYSYYIRWIFDFGLMYHRLPIAACRMSFVIRQEPSSFEPLQIGS